MNMGEKANRYEGEYKLLELHGVYEPAKDKISFSSNTLVLHYLSRKSMRVDNAIYPTAKDYL